MTTIIRELKTDDLKACSKLYSQVFSNPPWSENWDIEKAQERLGHFQRSEGFIGLVAFNEEVKGFVLGNAEPFLEGHWFYLREMCVSTENQGQGIGSTLLGQLRKTLSKNKINNIYLATDRNIPAAKFYEKNGFIQEEKMGFYYQGI